MFHFWRITKTFIQLFFIGVFSTGCQSSWEPQFSPSPKEASPSPPSITVTSVSLGSDKTNYGVGQTFSVVYTFSGPILVESGRPSVRLQLDSKTVTTSEYQMSGDNNIEFSYTLGASDQSSAIKLIADSLAESDASIVGQNGGPVILEAPEHGDASVFSTNQTVRWFSIPESIDLSKVAPIVHYVQTDATFGVDQVDFFSDSQAVVSGGTEVDIGGGSVLGTTDIYVRKVDELGNEVWTHQLPSSGANDYRASVYVATDQSVWLTGEIEGDYGSESHQGQGDYFLAKFSENGVPLMFYMSGTTTEDRGQEVAEDSQGNIFVFGFSSGNIDGQSNASPGTKDCFLAKFDSSGTRLWTRLYGSSADEACRRMTINRFDEILLTFELSAGYESFSAKGGKDVYALSVSAENGAPLWSQQIGGAGEDFCFGVTSDDEGHFYATGPTYSQLEGANDHEDTSQADAYYVKLNRQNGAILTSRLWGTPGYDEAGGMGVTPLGQIVLGGFSNGDFPEYSGQGSFDGFIVAFSPEGEVLSSHHFGGSSLDVIRKVRISDDGSTVALGGYTNSANGFFTPSTDTRGILLYYDLR